MQAAAGSPVTASGRALQAAGGNRGGQWVPPPWVWVWSWGSEWFYALHPTRNGYSAQAHSWAVAVTAAASMRPSKACSQSSRRHQVAAARASHWPLTAAAATRLRPLCHLCATCTKPHLAAPFPPRLVPCVLLLQSLTPPPPGTSRQPLSHQSPPAVSCRHAAAVAGSRPTPRF